MKFLIVMLIIRLLIAAFGSRKNEAIQIEFTEDETTGLVIHPAEYLLRWE